MSSQDTDREAQRHLAMALLGAAAGFAMWVLVDVLPDTLDNARLLLWIASATIGFFVMLFALLGGLRWQLALAGAAVLSLTDAALLYWSSGRFLELGTALEDSALPYAWAMVLFIGAPFATALLKGRPTEYALLFETAWTIVVRYVAAWIFVGIFWGLLFLSDELLEIVGLTIIGDLVDEEPVPYLLTGTALGLALSVAQDLKAYVSPYLPLRLLRLLLPMVLVVVTVFILALPARGLSGLFGSFSAAAIMMSVAIAAITLITSALDRSDGDGVQSRWMHHAVRLLGLLLTILAGLAIWAISLRVLQYGWTPHRCAAALVAGLVLIYALLYGAAILRGSGWRQWIRQANVGMALLTLGLATLWMTPLLNVQKLSVDDQMARYLSGQVTAEDFPAWEFTHDYGIAGHQAVAALKALDAEEHAVLHARLDRATTENRWEFRQNQRNESVREIAEALPPAMKVWPEGRDLPADYFTNAGRHWLEEWSETCVADSVRPCVLVFGPFGRQGAEIAYLFVPEAESGATTYRAVGDQSPPQYFQKENRFSQDALLSEEAYAMVVTGGYRIGPASRKSLWLGEIEVTSDN